LPEQKNSPEQKREVGKPNPGGGREASLARERHSDQRNRVVEKDQQNGQDKSAGLAALFSRRGRAECRPGEHDAGGGQREAAMVFDQVPAAGDGVGGARDAQQSGNSDFASGGFVFLGLFCAAGIWIGMSVVWKVEIWYWSGFLGSVS
jgi:hypothetical protein